MQVRLYGLGSAVEDRVRFSARVRVRVRVRVWLCLYGLGSAVEIFVRVELIVVHHVTRLVMGLGARLKTRPRRRRWRRLGLRARALARISVKVLG